MNRNHTNKLKQRRAIKLYKPKVRRGKRKSLKRITKSLRFLGVNAAGLKSKLLSFRKVLTYLQPSVFFVEETKCKDEGQLKLGNNFIIYELLRQDRTGGGLALGCAKDLHPAWVREGNDQVEALSVDIFIKKMKICCCVGYGPQENDKMEKKDAFWSYLDNEVMEASIDGAGFVLHCDGNLWAGNGIIPGDPRPQNRNGKKNLVNFESMGVIALIQIYDFKIGQIDIFSRHVINFSSDTFCILNSCWRHCNCILQANTGSGNYLKGGGRILGIREEV